MEKLIQDLIESINQLTGAVEKLGINDADTRMGAIELVAKEIKEIRVLLEDN